MSSERSELGPRVSRSALGGGRGTVQTVAGLTFRVGWSEFERDYVAQVDELPALRCYDATREQALVGIMSMVLRGAEQGDEDAAPLLAGDDRREQLRVAVEGIRGEAPGTR